ncbi:hypothetical protein ACLQ2C_36570 [Streptomyces sp. DT73]|uniref:hypothetical protein n=1 Tax=Streptomyces sp. DT73 TaxID=3393420 RepID=UPI003CF6831C
MTATPLYEIETSEGHDGTMHPVEQLWTPGEDAVKRGFVVHRGLYVAGIDDATEDRSFPIGFVLLGHQTWGNVIEAAAAYMAQVYGWRNLHLYPGDDPSVLIPRIPRAVQTWGAFLRHPHDDHLCGCEWDETWRIAWSPRAEPGAVPITAMRHPAAPPAAGGFPDPDQGAPATWAA